MEKTMAESLLEFATCGARSRQPPGGEHRLYGIQFGLTDGRAAEGD